MVSNNLISFLIVDDSSSILLSLKLIINDIIQDIIKCNRKLKFNIETYKSFKEYLQKREPNYDIAIIDWNLPDAKAKDIVENLNGSCKYKTIYTGMTDDNMEISKYCLQNKITYIPKGSEILPIEKYITKTMNNIINEKQCT